MRNLLSEQELTVLRAQGIISSQEIAFRDDSGVLFAENVLTRTKRGISGIALESANSGQKLLLG